MASPRNKPYLLDPCADPVAEGRELRARGPLVRVELPGEAEAWAATDHSTAREVLGHKLLTKDPEHWPALQEGAIPDDWPLIALVRGASFLMKDGEEHRRLRGLVGSAFSVSLVKALEPRVRELADGLLDGLEEAGRSGPVDLREHFALPLPVSVICEMLGVPDTSISDLRGAFDRLVTPAPEGGEESVAAAIGDITSSLSAVIQAKHHEPGDDLTTALIQAREDGDRLSDQELVETLFLLLIAGHETTVNAITNTVRELLKNPDVLAAALRGDVSWESVVEEGLRLSSPVRHALLRYATEEVDIAGVRVEPGEPVLACLHAAGRDPGVHEEADRFDPLRSTSREHVAFGYGAHHCPGAHLARLETQVALAALFTRFPALALAAEPAPLASIPLQGFQSLPVLLGPSSRTGVASG